MNLTSKDLEQLKSAGILPETVENQFRQLTEGPEKLQLKRPCTVGDGIKPISNEEKTRLMTVYPLLAADKDVVRFTPASGAATRMFKHLFNPKENKELVEEFIENLEYFAFFDELKARIPDLFSATDEEIIEMVLSAKGLNYGKLPKALISFHAYADEIRKAIDEQLVEGVHYVQTNGVAKFHFTISPEHEDPAKSHLAVVVPEYEKRFDTQFEISYSTQSKSTDTVALDSNGNLARTAHGSLLLRPGGHGALIHNLNNLDADVVFIKNIDNIVREEYQGMVIEYKKVLAAILLELQNRVFSILRELDTGNIDSGRLREIAEFAHKELNLSVEEKAGQIKQALNRPMRVCGMVKNEGKAGGGPFWVGDSVQIVETAQMDTQSDEVRTMLQKASHFNPVDLVCGLRDYRGKKFDLRDFIDKKTFFVSTKSFEGKAIKVLEHPGLWNGAMANWLTVFVEVPVETFHPVKTVNDLLQQAHQANF